MTEWKQSCTAHFPGASSNLYGEETIPDHRGWWSCSQGALQKSRSGCWGRDCRGVWWARKLAGVGGQCSEWVSAEKESVSPLQSPTSIHRWNLWVWIIVCPVWYQLLLQRGWLGQADWSGGCWHWWGVGWWVCSIPVCWFWWYHCRPPPPPPPHWLLEWRWGWGGIDYIAYDCILHLST